MSPDRQERERRIMAECIRLAERGTGRVSPNPLVGAVLARGDKILSRGYHRKFGGPHAEVECLRRYRGQVRDTTLYVNLEPCTYHGKTPPCTDLLIRSGIRNIVVGMTDPNPLIAGRGIRKLRRAGITVRLGVLQTEARELNRKFIKLMTSNTPYVHVKVAQTIDGMLAPIGGHRQWISGKAARTLVHRWRSEYDAVLVGSGTIRADNPLLNVRLSKGRDPQVIILDGKLRSPTSARVFSHAKARRVILCVDREVAKHRLRTVQQLQKQGVTVLKLAGRNGFLRLPQVLRALYWLDIGSILVEGGARVLQQFLGLGVFDELSIFVAPRIMGNGIPAFGRMDFTKAEFEKPGSLANLTAQRIGRDILLHAYKGR